MRGSINSKRLILRATWVAACLALAAWFGYQGVAASLAKSGQTPANNSTHAAIRGTPIELIRVGQRVVAHNPLLSEAARNVPDPDSSWGHLTLRMESEPGQQIDIELLRPSYWIQQHAAYPGHTVFLELCEMGAYGDATVVDLASCPPIGAGSGRVVTGTFRHSNSAPLYNVQIEGELKPLGVTENHPFWSEDRQDFVEAGQLQVGERLLARDGEIRRVASLTPRPGVEQVYNLEVHREHVYQVAEQGLLVHNCSGKTGKYSDVGGHHVHAKAGFKNASQYSKRQGFSISQKYMKSRGWDHQAMTNKQRDLFNRLAKNGGPNTLKEHSRIAVEALEAGGATRAQARQLVAESLRNLRNQGVRAPTNIPWN